MLVTLSRIIKYGWQAFLRSAWLSISTISVMFLATLVFGGLILFNVVANGAVTSLQEKIDISVYFKSNASEDSILNIKRSIEGLGEVRLVEYISREEALMDFKALHADEETITQTLEELDENPLLSSLNIKAKDSKEYSTIASYLESANLSDLVEKVSYAQNEIVINRLNVLIDIVRRAGFLLTVFLSFVAVMVTFNTIRLAIYSNSEQINVMRLVGASNSFIRGPYIVESVIYGAIAAILSIVIFIPAISFFNPYISSFIPSVNLSEYFRNNFFPLLFYHLLFGVGLGIVSSVIAIRRYLRA